MTTTSDRPGEVPAEVWGGMEREAYSSGRAAALGGARCRPTEAAELYAMAAVECWGELLPPVSTAAMEACVRAIGAAYQKGYAEVLGEAYADGFRADMAPQMWRRWRHAVDRERELHGCDVGATPSVHWEDAYWSGYYAGQGLAQQRRIV